MITRAYIITEPGRVLAFSSEGAARSLSRRAWIKEQRWSGHYAMMREGRVTVVDHCHYRRDGQCHHIDRDGLGRAQLHVTFPMIAALLFDPGGVTDAQICKMFGYDCDAKAALADLSLFISAVNTTQAALERFENPLH